mmetsp:Transcript_127492/g.271839  ORF Transcript_127492/g.271839 Transcript_127492/m.271839 type:complete len:100 (-) Transcript_127492:78-377(-)
MTEPNSPKGPSTTGDQSIRSHSIISGRSGRENRSDQHGNPIPNRSSTGASPLASKPHRASFADEVKKAPVAEVQLVESYKGVQIRDNDSKAVGCSCALM